MRDLIEIKAMSSDTRLGHRWLGQRLGDVV